MHTLLGLFDLGGIRRDSLVLTLVIPIPVSVDQSPVLGWPGIRSPASRRTPVSGLRLVERLDRIDPNPVPIVSLEL